MGRGLGAVQRRILELLETVPPDREVIDSHRKPEGPDGPGWTIADLSRALDLSAGRTRVAVSALSNRGLIVCTWEGVAVLRPTAAAGSPVPIYSYGWVSWTPAQCQQWRPESWAEITGRRLKDEADAWWRGLSVEERRTRVVDSWARWLVDPRTTEQAPFLADNFNAMTADEREAFYQRQITDDCCPVPYPPPDPTA